MNNQNSFGAVLGLNLKHSYESIEKSLPEGDRAEAQCRLTTGEVLVINQITVLSEDVIGLQFLDDRGRDCVLFCRPSTIETATVAIIKGDGKPRVGFEYKYDTKKLPPLPGAVASESSEDADTAKLER